MANLVPYDPEKHKPVDAVELGLPGAEPGMKATEFEASENSPDGRVRNIPQIWFDAESGEAVYLEGDRAWDEAKSYEERTGSKFPRFNNFASAVEAAKKRSAGGGAQQGALAKKPILRPKLRPPLLKFESK